MLMCATINADRPKFFLGGGGVGWGGGRVGLTKLWIPGKSSALGPLPPQQTTGILKYFLNSRWLFGWGGGGGGGGKG